MALNKEVQDQITEALKSDNPLEAEIEYKDKDGNPYKVILGEALESPMLKKEFISKTTDIAKERQQLHEQYDSKLNSFLEEFMSSGDGGGDGDDDTSEGGDEGGSAGGAGGAGDEAKHIAAMTKRLKSMEEKVHSMEESSSVKDEEKKLIAELTELRKEYPLMRDKEVLVAYANGAGTIADLAKASQKEMEAFRQGTIKDYADGKIKREGAHAKPLAGAAPGDTTTKPPQTLDEAGEAARRHLDKLRE